MRNTKLAGFCLIYFVHVLGVLALGCGGSGQKRGEAGPGSAEGTGGNSGSGGRGPGSGGASIEVVAITGGASSDRSGARGGISGAWDGSAASGCVSTMVSDGNCLVLDPSSLSFFNLPMGLIRWAVTGFAPSARTCVTVVWDWSQMSKGASCNEIDQHSPYVILVTNTDGPCGAYGYSGNVQVEGWSGCVDFDLQDDIHFTRRTNFVDGVVSVRSADFTGQVVLNNRSVLAAQPVVFGLKHSSTAQVPLYLQHSSGQAFPTWITVTRNGAPLRLFDGCNPPVCDSVTRGCPGATHGVVNLTEYGSEGVIYITWDGFLRRVDPLRNCVTKEPATAGSYQVQVCAGASTTSVGTGQDVSNPQCAVQDFTYPTKQVLFEVSAK